MKRPIVIIGANDFQNRLILKAKELGFETHVFAWRQGAVGMSTADYFYPISIVEKEKILEVCRGIKPCAVTSVASDLAVGTVTYVATALGLPCNSPECAEVSTDKYKMRKTLKEAGVATPGFAQVSCENDCDNLGFSFPLIVKPTDRSGSRGVTKVSNPAQLKAAVKACIDVSFSKKAIVEEFIDGDEYSAEYISFEGRHFLLAVTQKITTGSPHFIERGHIEPAQLSENALANVRAEIEKGLDALGIQNGAAHPEFKIQKDGTVHIIEIGARMGGDCIGSDLVPISTGMDFLKMTIDTACGKAPDFTRRQKPRFAAIRFVFDKTDTDVLQKIKQEAPESIFREYLESPVSARAVTDSSTRFGYYILAGDDHKKLTSLIGF